MIPRQAAKLAKITQSIWMNEKYKKEWRRMRLQASVWMQFIQCIGNGSWAAWERLSESTALRVKKKGLDAVPEVKIPIRYDGHIFDTELRADIVVENKVIIELKSVQELKDLFFKQTLTYLHLTGMKLGLLVNFNCERLKDGNLRRIVNGL